MIRLRTSKSKAKLNQFLSHSYFILLRRICKPKTVTFIFWWFLFYKFFILRLINTLIQKIFFCFGYTLTLYRLFNNLFFFFDVAHNFLLFFVFLFLASATFFWSAFFFIFFYFFKLLDQILCPDFLNFRFFIFIFWNWRPSSLFDFFFYFLRF